ncbi:hypothetical protein GCM10022262_34840 [Georgenia daeguensis]|uniref:Uncharacterized protein n=1 Tax=Georgenia daeguensis TaxID=908355 RepID=A0ABP8EZA3_9MICO
MSKLHEDDAHSAHGGGHAGHDPMPEDDRHGGVDTHVLHDAHAGHDMSHDGHGHGGHGDHVAQFRRLFWIMLVLAVPTVLLSSMFASRLLAARPARPRVGLADPGHGHLPLGRTPVPHRHRE